MRPAAVRGSRFPAVLTSDAGLAVVGVLATALLLQLGALVLDNPLVLPGLPAIWTDLWNLVVGSEGRRHLLLTLGRIGSGYGSGLLLGVVLGSLIGAVPLARRLLNPYLNYFRFIAPITWVVPAALWFGVGNPSIRFVVVYAVAIPVALQTMSGLAAVPHDKVRMGRVYGLGPVGTFWRILLPNAVPYIVSGARISLGFAFMGTVSSEMIVSTTGLGYLIFDARTYFDVALMFAGILLLGIVGYVADLVFVLVRDRLLRRFYARGSAL